MCVDINRPPGWLVGMLCLVPSLICSGVTMQKYGWMDLLPSFVGKPTSRAPLIDDSPLSVSFVVLSTHMRARG